MLEFFKRPLTEYTDPGSFAIPYYFILIGIELYLATKERMELYEKKDTWANLSMAFVTLILGTIGVATFYAVFSFLYQFRLFEIPNTWWAWFILMLADDFTYYWYHRWHHEIRIFWAAHVNHHSSQRLNFSTALRQPWTVALYYKAFWFWLPLVGFQPWMVMTMMSINLIYQYWTHTTIIGKLGFLEWFMNTPSHHRVHHASNVQYLDKNHAGIFIIWDRLFGTFQEEQEKPVYGLTTNIKSYNPIHIAFHEYQSIWKDIRKAKSFSELYKYLFYPPGWSPDGSTKTSKQLQKEMVSSKQQGLESNKFQQV